MLNCNSIASWHGAARCTLSARHAALCIALALAGCRHETPAPQSGGPACTSYPRITNIRTTAVDSARATVTWDTDCASDSLVSWAKSGDDNPTYATDIFDGTAGTTQHSVTVTLGYPGANRMMWARSRSIANRASYGFQQGPNITTAAAPAGAFDYKINLNGSHQVFAGGTAWVSFNATLLAGADSGYLYVTVSGLPANAVLIPDQYATGCSYKWDQSKNEIFLYRTTTCGTSNFGIATSARTPPGRYTLTVNYRNATPKSVPWELAIEPAPVFATARPAVYPAIPCLTQYSRRRDGSACAQNWQSQMVKYGQKWCSQVSPGWEGAVWYYDGTRVFYNVRAWDTEFKVTGDAAQWTPCIETQNQSYRDYVNGLSSLTGYRVFPHGLAEHWLEQGDDASKQALLKLRNAAYATPKEGALIGTTFVRELSYRLEADLIDTAVIADGTRAAYLEKWYQISLGRADQFLSGAIELQPFMVGLWFESLISCYAAPACPGYGDPRIPVVVKRVADYLWPFYGIVTNKNAWPYYLPSFVLTGDQPYYSSLNLLINFAYSWLWSITGETQYQDRSDRAFEDGVLTAPGDGADYSGKNYSQQYRLSFASVRYRSATAPASRKWGIW